MIGETTAVVAVWVWCHGPLFTWEIVLESYGWCHSPTRTESQATHQRQLRAGAEGRRIGKYHCACFIGWCIISLQNSVEKKILHLAVLRSRWSRGVCGRRILMSLEGWGWEDILKLGTGYKTKLHRTWQTATFRWQFSIPEQHYRPKRLWWTFVKGDASWTQTTVGAWTTKRLQFAVCSSASFCFYNATLRNCTCPLMGNRNISAYFPHLVSLFQYILFSDKSVIRMSLNPCTSKVT